MIKTRGTAGTAVVTFTLDPGVAATQAAICGDWNDWAGDRHVMRRDEGGGFSLSIELPAGRSYRFRYLLDGQRWENDWAADEYVRNDFGGDDSLVDLTALAEGVPSAGAAAAPVKKAAPKKAGPAKKAAPVKKAAAAKSAAPAKKAAPAKGAAAKKAAPAKKAAKKPKE